MPETLWREAVSALTKLLDAEKHDRKVAEDEVRHLEQTARAAETCRKQANEKAEAYLEKLGAVEQENSILREAMLRGWCLKSIEQGPRWAYTFALPTDTHDRPCHDTPEDALEALLRELRDA